MNRLRSTSTDAMCTTTRERRNHESDEGYSEPYSWLFQHLLYVDVMFVFSLYSVSRLPWVFDIKRTTRAASRPRGRCRRRKSGHCIYYITNNSDTETILCFPSTRLALRPRSLDVLAYVLFLPGRVIYATRPRTSKFRK